MTMFTSFEHLFFLKKGLDEFRAENSNSLWGKNLYQVIQSDLLIPSWRSPTTFERVMDHHPKKGTKNCQVLNVLFLLFFPLDSMKNNHLI